MGRSAPRCTLIARNFSEVSGSVSDKFLAKVEHVLDRPPAGSAQGALPNDLKPPAVFHQLVQRGGVPLSIALEFGSPEVPPCLGPLEPGAVVQMPEATVQEDHRPGFRKNQIRRTGQFLHMQAVPEAASMETAPQDKLRLRVPISNPAHVNPALLPRKDDLDTIRAFTSFGHTRLPFRPGLFRRRTRRGRRLSVLRAVMACPGCSCADGADLPGRFVNWDRKVLISCDRKLSIWSI